MKMEIMTKPEPRFIAQQLRKPSGEFAKKIGEKMNHINEALYDFVIDAMELNDHEKILEIGFGTGKFFNKLFSKADNLLVNGIDYSREMVNSAKELNQTAVSLGKLNIKLGNSDNIYFEDNSFDKVFCNNVIYFWKEPHRHLKEIYRVLKPGGKFYSGLRTRKSSLNFPFTKYGFVLYDLADWESILKQNGFSNINAKQISESIIEEGGKPMKIESICCIAEKKNT